MDDLEGKINSILSDPESMEQIMGIAKMLGAGGGGDPAPAGEDAGTSPESSEQSAAPAFDFSALGDLGIDPQMIMNLMGSLSSKSSGKSAALVAAIKPYLRQERQDKLERATKLAKLATIAKSALGSLNI